MPKLARCGYVEAYGKRTSIRAFCGAGTGYVPTLGQFNEYYAKVDQNSVGVTGFILTHWYPAVAVIRFGGAVSFARVRAFILQHILIRRIHRK